MAQSSGLAGKKPARKKSKNFLFSLKNTSFGESRSYIFEYGLQLLFVTGLLAVVMSMFNSLFDESILSVLSWLHSGDMYVWLISAFTVLLPLTVILIQRTAESEARNPAVKNLAWRKISLGIFLTGISVWAVLSSVLFIDSVLAFLSIGYLTQAVFDWQATTAYLFASLALLTTAWAYGNDYRVVASDIFARFRHQYRYGLITGSLIVALLFVLFPFSESRQVMVDRVIASDLSVIKAEVNNFVTARGYMPEALSDLNLSSEQAQRSNSYIYTYERLSDSGYQLCANFSTTSRTGDDKMSGYIPSLVTESSNINEWQHSSGRDCFQLTVTAVVAQPSADTSEVQGAEVTIDQPLEAPAEAISTEPVPEAPIEETVSEEPAL